MSTFNKYRYKLDDTFININQIKQTAQDPNKCDNYYIPLTYEFRPDLIANSLYNDVSMAEYLAIINDINDTPDGFYSGRKIRVLKQEYKETVC